MHLRTTPGSQKAYGAGLRLSSPVMANIYMSLGLKRLALLDADIEPEMPFRSEI